MANKTMSYTRRDIGKIALAAVPLARLQAKPDSIFGGVQVGAISYSFREMPDGNDAQAILSHMVELGLSGMELMNGPAEGWAGSPASAGRGLAQGRGGPPPDGAQAAGRGSGAAGRGRGGRAP